MDTSTKLIDAFNGTIQHQLPILHFCSPRIERLSEESCTIKLPLNRKTKSYLKAMSFPALAAGADCCGGLLVMLHIIQSGLKIDFVFSKATIDFIRKADDDVFFHCEDGAFIAKHILNLQETHESQRNLITVTGSTKQKTVARFKLELFLKKSKFKS